MKFKKIEKLDIPAVVSTIKKYTGDFKIEKLGGQNNLMARVLVVNLFVDEYFRNNDATIEIIYECLSYASGFNKFFNFKDSELRSKLEAWLWIQYSESMKKYYDALIGLIATVDNIDDNTVDTESEPEWWIEMQATRSQVIDRIHDFLILQEKV